VTIGAIVVVGSDGLAALRACHYLLGARDAPPADWFVWFIFHPDIFTAILKHLPYFKPSLVEKWI
jgi:hypothetical protein